MPEFQRTWLPRETGFGFRQSTEAVQTPPERGYLARTCNKRQEDCRKQGCKQFHTTLLHPPNDTKSNAGFKDTRS